MKTEKGHSILIWAVVALVVLNLSTLTTIFLQRKADSTKYIGKSDQVNLTAPPQSEKFSGRYFKEKLNMTTVQMREFQKFNPEFRNEARATNVRLAKLRGEMLNEMASPETDTSKLNALSDSIGNYHSRLKRITYKYYLDLKSICNPDQKIQLKELFSDTFNSDGPMGSQNGGSRGGRQFRGGFKN